MTRKRLPNKGRKRGPKTIFTNEQLKQVELLALLAATDKQIALFFGVHEDTIQNWLNKHQDFIKARRRGGVEADMKVSRALFQRAIGYEYEETKSIRTKNGDFLMEVTKKQLAPDTKAIIRWLGTRQREQWTMNEQMNHSHSGKIEHIHNKLEDIPVNELSKNAQNVLFEIASKQLSNGERDN